ncbi:DNA polymerase III subunit delta' [Clostridia bacterium]|nr:DNA polymerase III subunit delta' [Clostridia bacterium]
MESAGAEFHERVYKGFCELAAAFAETLCAKSDIAVLPVSGGDRVRVEDINWLTGDCWIKPFDSDVKVYVVKQADTMTEQAQNKLLKTLEEPPKSTVILLAACQEAKILRTVASRCRRVPCDVPRPREIYDCLVGNGVDDKRADFAAAFSGGSLYLADKMLASDVYIRAADMVFRLFRQMLGSRDILEFAAALNEYKDIFDAVLDFMTQIARDILAARLGKPEFVFTKRREADIIELAPHFSPAACTAIVRKINHAKKSLYYNCNFSGAIDELLFGFLEIKSGS